MLARAGLLLLVMAATYPLQARDIGSALWMCKLDVPDDWWVQPPDTEKKRAYSAFSHNQADTESVSISISSASPLEQSDQLKNLLHSLSTTSSKKITGQLQKTIGQANFDLITVYDTRGKSPVHRMYCLTSAGRLIYEIDLCSKTGEVSKSAALLDALNSFALVTR